MIWKMQVLLDQGIADEFPVIEEQYDQADMALVQASAHVSRKLDLQSLDQLETRITRRFDRALRTYNEIRAQFPPRSPNQTTNCKTNPRLTRKKRPRNGNHNAKSQNRKTNPTTIGFTRSISRGFPKRNLPSRAPNDRRIRQIHAALLAGTRAQLAARPPSSRNSTQNVVEYLHNAKRAAVPC